jgi:hypothetical protein
MKWEPAVRKEEKEESQAAAPSERARPRAALGASPSSVPARGPAKATVVVPFPSPLVPLRSVKSTLLMASVAALRETGRYDDYHARLEPEFDEALLRCIAGTWVPERAARAHYRACDALALSPLEQMAVGQRTGIGLKTHLTRVATVVSRSAGVTPWSLFEQWNRFWARTFDGGGVSVMKLGPKEAEVVYAQCSLLESPYFRSALRGVAVGLLGAVTQRSFMSELPAAARVDEIRYRFSWV